MARRPTAAGLRIRMYNVGFGDCFLLFVPTSNGVRKIVIDCGSIKANGRSIQDIAGQLIDDCREGEAAARPGSIS